MGKLSVKRFDIDGLALVIPTRHGDERGWFCETWNADDWTEAGLPETSWMQDNEAFSAAPGTLRGLHFQAPPAAQAKLIRCVRGEIFDVAVDIRKTSPTYGKHVAITLTAKVGEQLFVPEGFAHGYQTLKTDTLVAYKVSSPYAPNAEGGLFWADVKAGIKWPKPEDVVMSGRDFNWPGLADLESPFE
ncbi:MAG: dTDP-4-dehydrorhamnose 3,5-epimerase [Pseudomonadota bacterium]